MRIMRVLAAVIALVGFGGRALADSDDYTTVHRHGSPASAVLRDTISGGLLGAAVSGGIIGYEMGIQNHSNYDWQRTLAYGAAIGLGVGLIWGIVDATSGSYAMAAPLAVRDGMSTTLDLRRQDQSGRAEFPVVLGRF